ncbi:MAG: hypothetical protein ACXQT3_06180 [Methermicoccaceae archaeon]
MEVVKLDKCEQCGCRLSSEDDHWSLLESVQKRYGRMVYMFLFCSLDCLRKWIEKELPLQGEEDE